MRFEGYLINGDQSVSEAMSRLEMLQNKILFIAPGGRLEAVVTDGDIRRYLVTHKDLGAAIRCAASQNPLAVQGYHEGRARALIEEKGVSCVPMLDDDGRIHELVFRDSVIYRDCTDNGAPVIMMAGGFGTRLRPYTDILPKPLIPVGGLTITEHIIRRFLRFRCRDITLVVNYKKNLIKSYFSEVDTGADISFVDEDVPLGTGGGLSFFKGRFTEPVFVTNCDSVIEADYSAILRQHRESGSILTMVCAQKVMTIPYGVVETDSAGRLVSMKEKPSTPILTNTGFYVVSPEFIDMIPDGQFTPITDIIEKARAQGKHVGVFSIDDECFIDIGQMEDLRSVEGKLV